MQAWCLKRRLIQFVQSETTVYSISNATVHVIEQYFVEEGSIGISPSVNTHF